MLLNLRKCQTRKNLTTDDLKDFKRPEEIPDQEIDDQEEIQRACGY